MHFIVLLGRIRNCRLRDVVELVRSDTLPEPCRRGFSLVFATLRNRSGRFLDAVFPVDLPTF